MTNTATPAPRPTTPVSTDGGSQLGVLLGSLGFGEVQFREGSMLASSGDYFMADHADGVRVVSWPDDGGRVKVIGWDMAVPHAKLVAWELEFSGSTPLDVVAGALAVALGKLAVR